MAVRLTIPAGEVRPRQDHLDLSCRAYQVLGTRTGDQSDHVTIRVNDVNKTDYRYKKTDRIKVIRYETF